MYEWFSPTKTQHASNKLTKQAEKLGVVPKNLAVIIHRLRHHRKLTIATLDRRKMKWIGEKEQTYQLMDKEPSHEEVASP